MIKSVLKILSPFTERMQKAHIGAYAATCAYFLMISFVPFLMIFLWSAHRANVDTTQLIEGIISIVPSGLKAYVESVIDEVNPKTFGVIPVSFVILVWSASKIFHALTMGFNSIGNVAETRSWLYLRFRSMCYVVIFFIFTGTALLLSLFGQNVVTALTAAFPGIEDLIEFFWKFRTLFGYFGLLLLFLFLYKFLPNTRYTFRSQFPGALIVSTLWMFLSYLMTVYYDHNKNFARTYGSMTSMILAMIWLYLCSYFLMFGALLNRVIYEDPEDNVIVNTVDAVKDASAVRQMKIAEELSEHSFADYENEPAKEDAPSSPPDDIRIPWYDTMKDEWDREEEELSSGHYFDQEAGENDGLDFDEEEGEDPLLNTVME